MGWQFGRGWLSTNEGKEFSPGKRSAVLHLHRTCRIGRDLQGLQRPEETSRKGLNDLLHPTEPEPPEHGGFGDQQLALSPPQHSTMWNLLEPEGSANLAFEISTHLCQQSTPHIIFYFLFSII